MKNWTTKDLLNAAFDFRGMVPDSSAWNEQSLIHNKPRLIRFRRLNSLFKAFELFEVEKQEKSIWSIFKEKKNNNDLKKVNISSIFNGNFIFHRGEFEYTEIKEIIEKEKVFESDNFSGLKDIYFFYSNLIKYRYKIENVLIHNSGVLEASSLGFRSAISLTDDFNNNIRNKIDEIDELLFQIINPKGLSFNKEILINEYNFPTDDLDAIDLDNF